jgi:hypothetical protein
MQNSNLPVPIGNPPDDSADELTRLAERIRDNVQAWENEVSLGVRKGLAYARQAGLDLIEAKRLCRDRGEQWVPWLSRQFGSDKVRSIQGYMRIAERWDELQEKTQHVAFLSIRDALKLLASPRKGKSEGEPPQHVEESENVIDVEFQPPVAAQEHDSVQPDRDLSKPASAASFARDLGQPGQDDQDLVQPSIDQTEADSEQVANDNLVPVTKIIEELLPEMDEADRIRQTPQVQEALTALVSACNNDSRLAAAVALSVAVCPEHGKFMDDEGYCIHCGAKVASWTPPVEKPPKANQPKKPRRAKSGKEGERKTTKTPVDSDLEDKVQAVLSCNPDGLKLPDIGKKVVAAGYKSAESQNLSQAVYNVLGKLKKEEKVEKDKDTKLYRLVAR